MQDRISGLDGLRGIAACAVAIHHIAAASTYVFGGQISPWTSWGRFGVEVFFVVSGFVILMTIERSVDARAFVVSRFARLFPAYWTAVLVAAAAGLLAPSEKFPTVSLALTAENMTMFQRFLSAPSLDWSYWTLAYELAFYYALLAVFRAGALRYIDRLCLCWLAFGTALKLSGLILIEPIATALLADYGQFFAMGIAIYRISTDRGTIWTYLVIAAALFLCSLGGGPISYNAPPALYLLVGIFAGGAVWLAVTAPPKFLVSRPILFLGAISYPFYLVHFRLSYLVMAETPLPPALSRSRRLFS
jgi:peptidoglycan/LPS O-acetylase OafA/YrhL